MSTNDAETEGESEIFGVPTRIGDWELEAETMTGITWQRDLDETDIDPDDAEEKPLFEWVIVHKVASGGAWRAELRKGFADTTMIDRPVITQIDQSPATNDGRDAALEAAVEFMQERGGEDREETPAEDEIIAQVIEEQDAEEVGRWQRAPADTFETDRVDQVLVRWEDPDGLITVYVGRDTRDGEAKYSARGEKLTDDANFGNTSIKFSTESLETALDEAVQWMRRHRPGVPLPTFSMQIEGGIFKPLMDTLRRLGGGMTLIEVRSDSVVFESGSHVGLVEFRIPASDMESFEVEQEGELAIDTSDLWEGVKERLFGDVLPVSIDGSEDPPRLGIAGRSTIVKQAAAFNRRSIPEITNPDARFTIDGIEYRDKLRAVSIIDSDSAVFGLKDSVAFIRIEDEAAGELATARLDTTDQQGEQVVIVNPDFLNDLRSAMPRPSQTPITFTLKGNDPMLAEFSVSDTGVDARIALKTGPVPREIDVPPAEIVVPEGEEAPEPPPDEEPPDELEGFVEQAAEEADAEQTEPDGIELPVSVAATLGDRLVYAPPPNTVSIGVSEEINDEMEAALGPASQFEEGKQVGTAVVTEDDIATQRELRGVTADVEPPQDEPDEEPEPEKGPTDDRPVLRTSSVGAPEPGLLSIRSEFSPGRSLSDGLRQEIEDAYGITEIEDLIRVAINPGDRFRTVPDRESVEEVGRDLLQNWIIKNTGFTSDVAEPLSRFFDDPDEVMEGVRDMEDHTQIPGVGPVGAEDIREVLGRTSVNGEGVEPGEAETSQLNREQIEEVLELTTVATDAAVQMVGSVLREIKLRPDPEAELEFRGGSTTLTTTARDTAEETIAVALEKWDQQIDPADLTADQREDLNSQRALWGERLDHTLPQVSVAVPPPEEDGEEPSLPFSEREIKEIINASVEGANPVVSVNADADSLRINWDIPDATGVNYERDPQPVQGAASDPVPTIIEAIEEWEKAVALGSIDRPVLVDRRENEEEEFGIDLPIVPRPGREGTAMENVPELAERITTIERDFDKVPIETENLQGVPGFDLPVQIKQETSEFHDQEGRTSLEQGLEIHFTEDLKDDVHAQVAEVLDAEPDKLYDGTNPSQLPGFDLFWSFDLRRTNENAAWTNRRFDPSTLFELLAPLDGNKIQAVSDAGPLA